jgi:hypothetical protein
MQAAEAWMGVLITADANANVSVKPLVASWSTLAIRRLHMDSVSINGQDTKHGQRSCWPGIQANYGPLLSWPSIGMPSNFMKPSSLPPDLWWHKFGLQAALLGLDATSKGAARGNQERGGAQDGMELTCFRNRNQCCLKSEKATDCTTPGVHAAAVHIQSGCLIMK